jgi:hypothetical protein
VYLKVRWFYKREVDKEWTPFMGYDSLRIELRYRHIWQTKWAAAANNDDGTNGSGIAGATGPITKDGQQSSQRGRRSTSLNRNVHYETEPDPGVDSPVGNKGPPSNGAGSNPANHARGGGSNHKGFRQQYR